MPDVERDRLEGRLAFYNNLKPGSYAFHVAASDTGQEWQESQVIVLEQLPFYYQTKWFMLLLLTAALSLLFLVHRLRVHRVAREFNVRLEERVGERIRLAHELHDTMLQSFQGLIFRLQAVHDLLPVGKAKDLLEKSLERADQAIAEGRNTVFELRSSATTKNDLADAIKMLGEELAMGNSGTFHLLVEGASRDLHPIIRDEIYRITCEGLRNAFSHARASQIETEISYGERLFQLRIRDNGQGIPTDILEDGRPGHYGLAGMRERAGQLGGKLEIWSRKEAGTEIHLSIISAIAYGMSPDRFRFRLFRRNQVDP
jgi:signal transduction histidine kinase